MATNSPPQDVPMTGNQTPPSIPSEEPKYGGFTRFEIELEFVQSLASPSYLNHLAVHKYFEQPGFVEYLRYLQYWTRPPYLKYLQYPGPTLKNLELLQQARFRTEILDINVVASLAEEGKKASVEWHEKR
ncbi:Mediator complex subunit 31 [Hyphodiscus hymeniophilus]|uniref:Mediator of RNA polymerase II transcription subunit 31 n=1 Tax=Hyphodiscus hymeniophilus TaxID=353542 RepID=A0A9P7B026_9HELO|nr:Mediator complex subunit 31 [Hyphodiscus hymeniophilus]